MRYDAVSQSQSNTIAFPRAFWTLVVLSSRAEAGPINGGFESGFSGYTTAGQTSIVTASYGSGPTQGVQEALLTTAGPFDIPPGNAVDTITLEGFLRVPPGTLSTISNSSFGVLEGSAIVQTFTAKAGDVLQFDFNFLTNELKALPPFNDLAFVTINTTPILLADVNTSTFVTSSTPFSDETGFQTFSVMLPTTETYTLRIGVADVGDHFRGLGPPRRQPTGSPPRRPRTFHAGDGELRPAALAWLQRWRLRGGKGGRD